MSWECPHLLWQKKGRMTTAICQLDQNTCSPGQGICVLKGKVKISSVSDSDNKKE